MSSLLDGSPAKAVDDQEPQLDSLKLGGAGGVKEGQGHRLLQPLPVPRQPDSQQAVHLREQRPVAVRLDLHHKPRGAR